MDYREELKNITISDILHVKDKKLAKKFRNEFCDKMKCFIGTHEDCAGIWKCAYWSTFLYKQLQKKDKVIEKLMNLLCYECTDDQISPHWNTGCDCSCEYGKLLKEAIK